MHANLGFALSTDHEMSHEEKLAQIPYAALLYCIAECNYGGRVTDTHDRRLINTLIQRFITPDIHTAAFQLFPGAGAGGAMPEEGGYRHYLGAVEGLPLMCSAGMMGLHANAEITCAISQTEQVRRFNETPTPYVTPKPERTP
jgi:dynein heavy chain